MLDNHQFSLIIISVGLAAYLGSLTGWHRDQIDLLTEKVTTLSAHAVENKKQDGEVSQKEPVAQMEEVTQQLRDLKKPPFSSHARCLSPCPIYGTPGG